MALPKVQKAVLHNLKSNTLSLIHDSPVPVPDFSKRHHLIRVVTTRPATASSPGLSNRLPIPCNDLAGVVIQAPEDSPFPPGTAVFGRTIASRVGDARDYTIALESELVRKPEGLGWEETCAVPLSAETAWQCLFDKGGLAEPGSAGIKANKTKRILITGASGSVGMWTVQLAKLACVGEIVGVARTDNVDSVKGLGAHEVVDYKTVELAEWGEANDAKNKVDIVIDCVGGKALGGCWSCVKDGGVLMSVTSVPETSKPEGFAGNVTSFFFIMTSDGKQLERIAGLVEKGECKPFVDSVWNFEDFQKAFDRVKKGSGLKGKVIINVDG